MLLTSKQVAEIVAEMEKASYLEFKTGNIKTALFTYLELWNKLPEPKYEQPEQISNSLVSSIFNIYFEIGDYIEEKNRL